MSNGRYTVWYSTFSVWHSSAPNIGGSLFLWTQFITDSQLSWRQSQRQNSHLGLPGKIFAQNQYQIRRFNPSYFLPHLPFHCYIAASNWANLCAVSIFWADTPSVSDNDVFAKKRSDLHNSQLWGFIIKARNYDLHQLWDVKKRPNLCNNGVYIWSCKINSSPVFKG